MPWTDWSGPSLNLTRSQSLQDPLLDGQLSWRAAGADHHPARRGVKGQRDLESRVGPGPGMARPDHVGRYRAATFHLDGDDLLALARGYRRIGTVECGRAEAAAEVGHSHPREDRAAGAIGGVRAGAAEDGRGDPRGREPVPDRGPAAEVHGPGRREDVLLLVPVQAVVGQVRLRITAEEVEDAVTAGIHPGGERRPGHGCLGRGGRGHAGKSARGNQLRQVRQLSGRQHRLDEARLEPVETDHDHSLRNRPASRAIDLGEE